MALPTSGAITLGMIQAEFGGSNPASINEYYRGGSFVLNTPSNAGIPTSGQISFSNFYGASASVIPTVQSTYGPTLAGQISTTNNFFGRRVILLNNGLRMIVSAPGVGAYHSGNSLSSGYIYVYNRDSTSVPFTLSKKCNQYDTGSSSSVGTTSTLNGTGLAAFANAFWAGAPNYTSSSPSGSLEGCVYCWDGIPTNPIYQYQLFEPPGARAANNKFGEVIAISGDGLKLVVSSPGRRTGRGGITIFTRLTSVASFVGGTSISGFDDVANTRFGRSLALDRYGSVIVVGQGTPGTSPANYGKVHILNGSGSLIQTLVSPDIIADGNFGASVAISDDGNIIAIGRPGNTSTIGKVYIYTRSSSTWSIATSFSASDGAAGDRFGISVAMNPSGTALVVGAHASSRGAAYLFTRSGSSWSQANKYLPGRLGEGFDNTYGVATAISENGSVVALGNGRAFGTGSVYTFSP